MTSRRLLLSSLLLHRLTALLISGQLPTTIIILLQRCCYPIIASMMSFSSMGRYMPLFNHILKLFWWWLNDEQQLVDRSSSEERSTTATQNLLLLVLGRKIFIITCTPLWFFTELIFRIDDVRDNCLQNDRRFIPNSPTVESESFSYQKPTFNPE